jgi:hypothetical protein
MNCSIEMVALPAAKVSKLTGRGAVGSFKLRPPTRVSQIASISGLKEGKKRT